MVSSQNAFSHDNGGENVYYFSSGVCIIATLLKHSHPLQVVYHA